MPITLGSNISSLMAQRELSGATSTLAKTLERVSSGLRINRASDDPAGLSIAKSLEASARVYTQAARNVNDGISMLSIADDALKALSELVARQLELSEEAANGTYSLTQRKALHSEANALVNEFNRIVQVTSFNGISLLDGSTGDTSIQAGFLPAELLTFNTLSLFQRNIGTGTFGAQVSYTTISDQAENVLCDFNGDGNIDIYATSGSFLAGNGDGSFKAAVNYTYLGGDFVVSGDFNRDGKLDVLGGNPSGVATVVLGNGDGSFKAGVSFVAGTNIKRMVAADFNGDGNLDFAEANALQTTYTVVLGNGNGTFKAAVSYNYPSAQPGWGITAGDVNGDGRIDIISTAGNSVAVELGNGDGTFSNGGLYLTNATYTSEDIELGDFNGDGILDIATSVYSSTETFSILLGNGNGSFKAAVSYTGVNHTESVALGDLNGDGITDIAIADAFGTPHSFGLALGNGDGTFKATQSFAVTFNPYDIKLADLNNDGVSDVITGGFSTSNIGVFMQNTQKTSTMPQLYLLSQSSARDTIPLLEATLDRIRLQQGGLGAFESRLSFALNNVENLRVNLMDTASSIMDADMAQEVAALTRKKILQQAAAAVMTQANQEPAIALRLLKR